MLMVSSLAGFNAILVIIRKMLSFWGLPCKRIHKCAQIAVYQTICYALRSMILVAEVH